MDEICLTPPDLKDGETGEAPDLLFVADEPAPYKGWWRIWKDGQIREGIPIHTRELANIPPVKAALNALRWWQKVDTLADNLGADDPTTWDTIEIARTATTAALAPFQEAPDET